MSDRRETTLFMWRTIKNTLETFWVSHDVGRVSVVSETNKSTQAHFGYLTVCELGSHVPHFL
jgi:hypothetical protein